MLGLPKSTEMNKQLPKKAIYAKFQMDPAAKSRIDADISKIYIVNEISPGRVNIPAGADVKSFFVLLVFLKNREFDEKTIGALSKLIPQNILFILEYEGSSRLAIYHTKLMQTPWRPTDALRVELQGVDLDQVWENIVIAVGGIQLEDGRSLDEQITADETRQKLEREIAALEKKIRNEKQFNRQVEMNGELKKLRRELDLL